MSASHRTTEITATADAAVAINKFVKLVHPGAASYEPGTHYVEQSAAAGTANVPFGVSASAATAADKAVRVVKDGVALVKLGGTVTPGMPLKSDANGDAVDGSGNSAWVGGFALEDGVDDDVILIEVRPCFGNYA